MFYPYRTGILDLAADPTFNSADRFVVTHVVAAAYHSGPQLRSVPGSTEVLATMTWAVFC